MAVGVLVAVVLLIESGKRVVRSIAVLARTLRVSEYVLSYVLLAFATSLPEFSVGINAALSGVSELSLGDIFGTNIINITLVMGVVAVIGKTVSLRDYKHFKKNRLYQMVVVLAPFILLLDGTLGRMDGLILFVLGIWSVLRLLDINDRILARKVLRPHLAEQAHGPAVSGWGVVKYMGLLVLSAVILLASTFAIVTIAKTVAIQLMVPTVVIGVLIIATITSLPELTIGVRSVLRGRGGVALGDVFGAATINSTFTLGTVALLSPIVVTDMRIVWSSIVFTVFVFLLVFFFLHTKHSLSRREGIVLIAAFFSFIALQIWLI